MNNWCCICYIDILWSENSFLLVYIDFWVFIWHEIGEFWDLDLFSWRIRRKMHFSSNDERHPRWRSDRYHAEEDDESSLDDGRQWAWWINRRRWRVSFSQGRRPSGSWQSNRQPCCWPIVMFWPIFHGGLDSLT